jgi:hypothetical protein
MIPTGILLDYGGYLGKSGCAKLRVARKMAMILVGCIIALVQNDSPQG